MLTNLDYLEEVGKALEALSQSSAIEGVFDYSNNLNIITIRKLDDQPVVFLSKIIPAFYGTKVIDRENIISCVHKYNYAIDNFSNGYISCEVDETSTIVIKCFIDFKLRYKTKFRLFK